MLIFDQISLYMHQQALLSHTSLHVHSGEKMVLRIFDPMLLESRPKPPASTVESQFCVLSFSRNQRTRPRW